MIFQKTALIRLLAQYFLILTTIFLPNNSWAQNLQPTKKIINMLDSINKAIDSDTKTDKAEADSQKTPEADKGPLSKITDSLKDKKDQVSSLMFDEGEVNKINQAVDALKNNQPLKIGNQTEEDTPSAIEDNAKSYIYLGSILYNSPKNWSVWINGQKISSENNSVNNDLYIKSINQDSANIVWTMSISKWKILANKETQEDAPLNANNQVEFNFTLSFNQTYILNGARVVEGIVIPITTTSK